MPFHFHGLIKDVVLSGLIAYASMGDKHQARLVELYQTGTRKPFGDTLDVDVLQNVLQQLLPITSEQ